MWRSCCPYIVLYDRITGKNGIYKKNLLPYKYNMSYAFETQT